MWISSLISFAVGYICFTTCVLSCENIPLAKCKQVLPYTKTTFPNYLGQQSAKEAINRFSTTIEILENTGCHRFTTLFLCSIATPKCDEVYGVKVPPCRELCASVLESCYGVLAYSSLDIDCGLFPTSAAYPQCISERMLVNNPVRTYLYPSNLETAHSQNRTNGGAEGERGGGGGGRGGGKTQSGLTRQGASKIFPTKSNPNQTDPETTTVVIETPKPTSGSLNPLNPSATEQPVVKLPEMTIPTSKVEGSTNENEREDSIWEERSSVNDVNDAANDGNTNGLSPATRTVLAVTVGTLVTMVTMLAGCICFRFYNKSKSTNGHTDQIPDAYSGFFANPVFENTRGNERVHGISTNGSFQGRIDKQAAAELALSQLPPHPASVPLKQSSRPQTIATSETTLGQHRNTRNVYSTHFSAFTSDGRNTIPRGMNAVTWAGGNNPFLDPSTGRASGRMSTLPPSSNASESNGDVSGNKHYTLPSNVMGDAIGNPAGQNNAKVVLRSMKGGDLPQSVEKGNTMPLGERKSLNMPLKNAKSSNVASGKGKGLDKQVRHTTMIDLPFREPRSLDALPPEKVLEHAGSQPYQAGIVDHYCTMNRNFANSSKKHSSKHLSGVSFTWQRKMSRRKRDTEMFSAAPSSTEKPISEKPGNVSQDLIFANPDAKEEDLNGNGIMFEIDLGQDSHGKDGSDKNVRKSGGTQDRKNNKMKSKSAGRGHSMIL